MKIRNLIITIITLLLTSCGPANFRVNQLFAPWDNDDTPGLAFAVVRDDRIIMKGAYGMANLEYDIPLTTKTHFQVASLSKQFTAYAILLLAHEGHLTLDDDIRDYLPSVPDFGEVITIRHALTHTSGLREQFDLLAIAGYRSDDPVSNNDVLRLVSRQKELNFTPGSRFSYCNTGYTLLAEIIRVVSGSSFSDFTKEWIFEPLEMDDSFFYDDHEAIIKNRAYSYYKTFTDPFTSCYKMRVLFDDQVGATNLFTTVEDMAKWLIFLNREYHATNPVIHQMTEKMVLNNGYEVDYGLGFFQRMYRGSPLYSHNGWHAGYKSFNAWFPADKLGMVVLSNVESFTPAEKAMRLVRILNNPTGSYMIRRPKNDKREPLSDIDPDLYTGTYYYKNFGGVIHVREEESVLMFHQAWDGLTYPMFPGSETEFYYPGTPSKIEFKKNDTGAIVEFVNYDSTAMKIDPVKESKLLPYEGTYYSEELDTRYQLKIKDNTLCALHNRNDDIMLYYMKKNSFLGSRMWFKYLRFTREKNKVTGFYLSSGGERRVKNMYFKKVSP